MQGMGLVTDDANTLSFAECLPLPTFQTNENVPTLAIVQTDGVQEPNKLSIWMVDVLKVGF